MKTTLSFFLLLFCSVISFAQIDYKGFPEWSHQQEGSSQYYLYTPSNMQVGEKYPIAIFLHGCCGTDDNATLRNCVDPPARMWHNFGDNTQKVPTYIIAAATSSGWTQHFTNLKAVMDDLIATGQGDPERVYITGFSMGSGATFDFVNLYPDYFAAVITMASTYRGDPNETKNIPWWINVGGRDSYADGLEATTANIRQYNGDTRGALEWVTGVNPLFTNFEEVGHGVQWDACGTTQDVVSWALSKINDGNAYPVVFFSSPDYKQTYDLNDQVILDITATDDDGTIAQLEIYQEGKLIKTQTAAPFGDTVTIHSGDNKFMAVATDNNGKKSTANITVKTDNLPIIATEELPDGKMGSLYEKQLHSKGNAPFSYFVSGLSSLPAGLQLSSDGLIKGIPVETGDFTVRIIVADDENDSTAHIFNFNIDAKNTDEVIITNAQNNLGVSLPTSKIRHLELPNSNANSSEISISEESIFEGITYIMTRTSDNNNSDTDLHSFDVDEDVTVYIGYEVKDNLYSSTVPSWLDTYTQESVEQIVLQYRYLNVYSKDFSAGTITLPGADATNNDVDLNYIIMVKKQGVSINTIPTISSNTLATGYIGYMYEETLSAVDGEGLFSWKLVSGSLPTGMTLDTTGYISGYCYAEGTYNFTVEVTDINGDANQKALSIVVESTMPIEPISFKLNDTIVVMNSAPHTISIPTLSNHVSSPQNLTVTASSSNNALATVSTTEINDSSYTLLLTPQTDMIGTTIITVNVKDNNNVDTLLNTTIKSFVFEVITAINNAPGCDPVSNKTAGLNNRTTKHSFRITGINDGNDGSQNLAVAITSTNSGVIQGLEIIYDNINGTGDVSFYPGTLGTETVTLIFMDDGGTKLDGVDRSEVVFTITVVNEADLLTITGTPEIEFEGFKIFPNPAGNWLFISASEQKYYSVEIHNISGQLIFEETNSTKINTSSFSSGVYILYVKDYEKIVGKEKIIINH